MANLNLSATLELIDRMSEPLNRIQLPLERTQHAFEEASQAVRQLEQQGRQLTAFAQRSEKIAQLNDQLRQSEQRLQQLRNALVSTANPSQTLINQVTRAEQATLELQQRLERENTTLSRLNSQLQTAGIETTDLAQAQQRLETATNQAQQALTRQEIAMARQNRIREQVQRSQQKWQNLRSSAIGVALGGAMAMTVPIKASIDFESSMADVKKVVDFGDDPVVASAGIKQMSDEIIRLSTIYPMAAKDIATIVAAGGQSGIAKKELTTFASDAIKMGVAFDISADQAGQAMVEMRTAFAMNQTQVVELADKINYLGNNTPAAAKSIMEIVQRIGPLGEVGGLASGSIAALGATMKGMGIAEDIAATGIKNMMLALVKGESATKSQKAVFKQLGLDSTTVAKNMQKDADTTILSILNAIGKLEKYEQASVLNELFGSESIGAIAPLLTQMDTVQKNLQMVGDKTKYASSMSGEYEARASTTANNLQLLKNNAMAVAITLGNTLLPAVNQLSGFISDVMERIRTWANANPVLASSMMKVAGMVVLVAGALAVLSTIMLTIIGPLAMLRASFTLLSGMTTGVSIITKLGTAFTWLGGVVRTVGLAMMSNPILLVIGVIAMGAVYIWQNWATLGPKFTMLWNNITTGARNLWTNMVSIWNSIKANIIATVQGLWVSITSLFSNGIARLVAIISTFNPVSLFMRAFSAVFAYFAGLGSQFATYGGNMIDGLKNGIMGRLGSVLAGIQSVASRIKSAFTSAMSIHSPSRIFMGYGDFIMQGLHNGLMANDSPITAMTTTSDQLKKALDTSTIHFGKSSPITAQSLATGTATQATAPININIYPTPNQSPSDIASLVAQEIAKMGLGKQTNNTALYDHAQMW